MPLVLDWHVNLGVLLQCSDSCYMLSLVGSLGAIPRELLKEMLAPRPHPLTQLVKNLPAMQENWVRFLGWEEPLETEMATPSSILT